MPAGIRALPSRPMLLLSAWTAAWFAILARHGGIAWIFLVKGSSLLFAGTYNGHNRPGFIHLYASYPGLQIGPLAFAVAQVIRSAIPGQPTGPYQDVLLAQLLMSAMGLVIVIIMRRVAVAIRPDLADRPYFRRTFLAGGALFMVAWTELAVAYAHLDDALALTLTAVAILAALGGHPVLTGLAIGLAVDAKPWALIFLPVLLLTDGRSRWRSPADAARPAAASLRPWLISAACAAAAIAVAWLPFFLAEPHTVRVLHYTIGNMSDSALRAFGVTTARTPSWDRRAQVIFGCGLGGAAIGRRRWPAVLLLGAGARIALDPGVHGYYTPSILVGALLWDLLGRRRPLPVWTAISFFALNVVPLLTGNEMVRGEFRLNLVIAFTLTILWGPDRWFWPAQPARRAGSLPKLQLQGDWLAAEPDPIWTQAVRPSERAFVVSVPRHDVGQAAAAHRTAIGRTQRLSAADRGRPERLGHAHAEVRDGQRDHQRHRGNAVRARRVP